MKTKILFYLLFLLCTVTFAQVPPSDFGDGTDENPTDEPAADIDSNLVVLFGAALVFGLYVVSKRKRVEV